MTETAPRKTPSPPDTPADMTARSWAAREDLPFPADRARRVHPTNNPEPRSRQMTTEEQQAEIAVGEKYGDERWRIKEVETGTVLRAAITSEREYRWLLDTFNHGDEYA